MYVLCVIVISILPSELDASLQYSSGLFDMRPRVDYYILMWTELHPGHTYPPSLRALVIYVLYITCDFTHSVSIGCDAVAGTGTPIEKVLINPFTVSEVLRLYLLGTSRDKMQNVSYSLGVNHVQLYMQ